MVFYKVGDCPKLLTLQEAFAGIRYDAVVIIVEVDNNVEEVADSSSHVRFDTTAQGNICLLQREASRVSSGQHPL